MRTSEVAWTVTFDGRSAIVRRHTAETYRRWFRTRTREVPLVVGVFPCQMRFEIKRALNKPGTIALTLGSYSFTLKEQS